MKDLTLREFIKKYEKLIDNCEFEKIYRLALSRLEYGGNVGELTGLFYQSEVDPLEYMSKIPDYYAIQPISPAARLNLLSINIPSNITSIGELAFANNVSLAEVNIFDGARSIGNSAFHSCVSLRSVTIPESVARIGPRAFYGCLKLKTIDYNGNKEQWNSIIKGQEWNQNSGIKEIHCKDGIINL